MDSYIDYAEIGQRIRQYRKERHLSQEQLAEAAGISVTHMSHIETGGTKLSLPVLASLSQLLSVSADSILFNKKNAENVHSGEQAVPSLYASSRSYAVSPQYTPRMETTEVLQIIGQCSTAQTDIISTIVKAAKLSLDKYLA